MVSIFIIDDDENLHKVYGSFFSMKGLDVIANAFNGTEAIETYVRIDPKPDVLLMDYRMPVKDGVTATKEIIEINPKCKIIFLSADETARDSAMQAGAASFLIKPVRLVNLIQTISTVIGNP